MMWRCEGPAFYGATAALKRDEVVAKDFRLACIKWDPALECTALKWDLDCMLYFPCLVQLWRHISKLSRSDE